VAKAVIMPRFGMTQEEATIVRWLVQEGDHVEVEDPIAEVTTDKVNMEVPAPAEGLIGGLRFSEGDTVPVTTIIAYILGEGETPPLDDPVDEPEMPEHTEEPSPSHGLSAPASPLAQRIAAAENIPLEAVRGTGRDGRIRRADVERTLIEQTGGPRESKGGRVRATPAARRLAHELQLPLDQIEGSGPAGRVQAEDVRMHVTAGPQAGEVHPLEPLVRPLTGMRKTIAERMQASAQEAPHISFDVRADMSRVHAFRRRVNDQLPVDQEKVSLTALLVKLTAWALQRHPYMNAHLRGDSLMLFPEVHIGVAVDIPDGLIVPVIRNAHEKGLFHIGRDLLDLTQRARQSRLRPEDVENGTFTLSNLGMFGVDRFTAIINPPQVGILAVGRIIPEFVPDEAGLPVLRPQLALTLSADHRAVDGVQAARFLADLRAAIEEPANTLL
jgi:pyruvate dehydrogenase E2 component (dihydrolipoamide acetyltransferase)